MVTTTVTAKRNDGDDSHDSDDEVTPVASATAV